LNIKYECLNIADKAENGLPMPQKMFIQKYSFGFEKYKFLDTKKLRKIKNYQKNPGIRQTILNSD